jgi:capsid portal protein
MSNDLLKTLQPALHAALEAEIRKAIDERVGEAVRNFENDVRVAVASKVMRLQSVAAYDVVRMGTILEIRVRFNDASTEPPR